MRVGPMQDRQGCPTFRVRLLNARFFLFLTMFCSAENKRLYNVLQEDKLCGRYKNLHKNPFPVISDDSVA